MVAMTAQEKEQHYKSMSLKLAILEVTDLPRSLKYYIKHFGEPVETPHESLLRREWTPSQRRKEKLNLAACAEARIKAALKNLEKNRLLKRTSSGFERIGSLR